MFDHASPGKWIVEGNVIYRVDHVEGGSKKKTEIARFRVFQIQGKSKLKGVGIEEAHDNAALVANAVNFWKQAEPFLRDAFNEGNEVLSAEAKNLLKEFYPEG